MIKHIGEKPYLCNQCGQSILQNNNFKHYLRKHTVERLHKCNYCEKFFSQKKLLRYTWEYTLGRSHTYCRSRTSILSFTWGNTQKRDHVNAAFVTKFSCRTSILSITWGNIQEKGHAIVEIVERLFHKNIILGYIWEYKLPLEKSHTYATFVTNFLAETEQQV